jgi:hypothetical protein
MANGMDPNTWANVESVVADPELADLFADDFAEAEYCEANVLLPGWRKSSGAKAEALKAAMTGSSFFCYAEGPDDHTEEPGWVDHACFPRMWEIPTPKLTVVVDGV